MGTSLLRASLAAERQLVGGRSSSLSFYVWGLGSNSSCPVVDKQRDLLVKPWLFISTQDLGKLKVMSVSRVRSCRMPSCEHEMLGFSVHRASFNSSECGSTWLVGIERQDVLK